MLRHRRIPPGQVGSPDQVCRRVLRLGLAAPSLAVVVPARRGHGALWTARLAEIEAVCNAGTYADWSEAVAVAVLEQRKSLCSIPFEVERLRNRVAQTHILRGEQRWTFCCSSPMCVPDEAGTPVVGAALTAVGSRQWKRAQRYVSAAAIAAYTYDER